MLSLDRVLSLHTSPKVHTQIRLAKLGTSRSSWRLLNNALISPPSRFCFVI